MIKVFVGEVDIVETAVNQFMTDKGKDFPVRTNTEIVANKLVYVATVFFDGVEKKVPTQIIEGQVSTPINVSDIPSKPKSDKIGALWKRGDMYSGKVEVDGVDTSIILTTEQWNALETLDTKAGDKMKIGNYKGTKFRIIVNKFKKTPKQPDFVLMRAD